ncbi:MAG: type II toxin-antitoxin system prevent-host-death family antitoxin [Actinomycetota bacterium]|jgi:prevent-host-death family protein|nr:type II toxin-antitoxin system prevent-host-death family antitoxin [Actinomycetota bacterium]
MDIGVRELKRALSEYLDRAAGGERITITDRGRPKALLTPLPGGDNVERGIADGWIASPLTPGPPPPPPRRFSARATVRDMIDEDRADA